MKKFTSIQKVWLVTNTALWTIAATNTRSFLRSPTHSRGGTEVIWPIEGFDQFRYDFSIEEWLLFAIGPWIVVYFLNKGKGS